MNARSQIDVETGHDSEEALLMQVVSRFAHLCEPGHPGPARKFQSYDAMLIGVLNEIDETMLPKQLTVVSDGQDVIQIVVSNRRLISAHTPQPTKHEQNVPTNDRMVAATRYIDLFRELLADGKDMSLRISPHTLSEAVTRLSCSAQMLAQAAGISIKGAAPELGPSFQDLQGIAKAWVLTRNSADSAQTSGELNLVDTLHKLDSAKRNTRNAASKFQPGKLSCTFLNFSVTDSVVICEDAALRFLAIIPSSELGAAIEFARKHCQTKPD